MLIVTQLIAVIMMMMTVIIASIMMIINNNIWSVVLCVRWKWWKSIYRTTVSWYLFYLLIILSHCSDCRYWNISEIENLGWKLRMCIHILMCLFHFLIFHCGGFISMNSVSIFVNWDYLSSSACLVKSCTGCMQVQVCNVLYRCRCFIAGAQFND